MSLIERFRSFKETWKDNDLDNNHSLIHLVQHVVCLRKLQKKTGCNKNEYFYYKLYEMDRKELSTYAMENGFNSRFVAQWNTEEQMELTASKPRFNRQFPRYINRDWIYMGDAGEEEFANFIKKHPVCIEKPMNGQSGNGVRVREFPSDADVETLFQSLKDSDLMFEERITQHHDLRRLNPDSVNTIRIITLRRQDKLEIIMAGLRIGRKGKCADNFGAGGLCGKIDFETGIITREAVDKNNHRYSVHPDTGEQILGFQIPQWNDLKQVAMEMAEKMEQNLLGWDLVVTEDNQIVVIEGNSAPDIMFMQLVEGHGFAEILSDGPYRN